MLKVTKSWVRPTVETPFLRGSMPQELKDHRDATYVQTGKLLTEQVTFSEDRLTMTYVGVWASQEDFDAYDADERLLAFWAARDARYLDMGITSPDRTFETI